MLVVLSPAKSLNLDPAPDGLDHSLPALLEESERLVAVCRKKSPNKLAALMGISADLATLNRDRFAAWSPEHTPDNAKPAALMFAGDTYRGFDAPTLGADDLRWAQDHVAILSGLYGLLRPLDLTQPYRLEMGSRLKTRRGSNLYGFWKHRITDLLRERLQDHADPAVVNCASNEYFSAIQRKALPRIIDVHFKEERADGTLQMISFFAKQARGMMARYVVTERIEAAEGLQGFNLGGYALRQDLSDRDSLVFSRPHPNDQ